jgi:hypothetical protein
MHDNTGDPALSGGVGRGWNAQVDHRARLFQQAAKLGRRLVAKWSGP